MNVTANAATAHAHQLAALPPDERPLTVRSLAHIVHMDDDSDADDALAIGDVALSLQPTALQIVSPSATSTSATITGSSIGSSAGTSTITSPVACDPLSRPLAVDAVDDDAAGDVVGKTVIGGRNASMRSTNSSNGTGDRQTVIAAKQPPDTSTATPSNVAANKKAHRTAAVCDVL